MSEEKLKSKITLLVNVMVSLRYWNKSELKINLPSVFRGPFLWIILVTINYFCCPDLNKERTKISHGKLILFYFNHFSTFSTFFYYILTNVFFGRMIFWLLWFVLNYVLCIFSWYLNNLILLSGAQGKIGWYQSNQVSFLIFLFICSSFLYHLVG